MRKTIKIVDEFDNPLSGAHVIQTGRGSSTGNDGIAYINSENGGVTISYVGTQTQTRSFDAVPSKVIMKMESLDEVTVMAKKEKTPKYLVPAIGAGLLLIALMSFGEETKEITL